jgi:hypothetical protein
MSDQLSGQIPVYIFAALVAILLFGVFMNRSVRLGFLAWWRGLDSRAAAKTLDPEILPQREAMPIPPEKGEGRSSRFHREKKEAPLHRSSPHVEKKDAPLHRNG